MKWRHAAAVHAIGYPDRCVRGRNTRIRGGGSAHVHKQVSILKT